MIDIGVNFAGRTYNRDKIKTLLDVFKKNGGESIISISNSVKEIGVNHKLSEFSLSTSNVNGASGFVCPIYYTAGCHPHGAKDMKVSDYDKIRACFSLPVSASAVASVAQKTVLGIDTGANSKSSSQTAHPDDTFCVAVGEMGLDYNRMFSPKEVQIEVFRQQVRIAKEFDRPMYLHVRDAFDDFINIIREEEYSYGVVHCFTGNLAQAELLIKYGFKLGITGWLLDSRRNADLVQVVSSSTVPLECLMVETDAPYMSMAKVKKKRQQQQQQQQEEAVNINDSSSSGNSKAKSVPKSKTNNSNNSKDGGGTSTGKKISHESEPADIVFVLEEIARLKNLPLDHCSSTILRTTKELFKL